MAAESTKAPKSDAVDARADAAIAPAADQGAAIRGECEAAAHEAGLADAQQLGLRVQRPQPHVAAAGCREDGAVPRRECNVCQRVLRRRPHALMREHLPTVATRQQDCV